MKCLVTLISEAFKDLIIFNPSIAINIKCHDMCRFVGPKQVNVGNTMPFAPSPRHHHFYRWYSNHSQSWVVNNYFSHIGQFMSVYCSHPISPCFVHKSRHTPTETRNGKWAGPIVGPHLKTGHYYGQFRCFVRFLWIQPRTLYDATKFKSDPSFHRKIHVFL